MSNINNMDADNITSNSFDTLGMTVRDILIELSWFDYSKHSLFKASSKLPGKLVMDERIADINAVSKMLGSLSSAIYKYTPATDAIYKKNEEGKETEEIDKPAKAAVYGGIVSSLKHLNETMKEFKKLEVDNIALSNFEGLYYTIGDILIGLSWFDYSKHSLFKASSKLPGKLVMDERIADINAVSKMMGSLSSAIYKYTPGTEATKDKAATEAKESGIISGISSLNIAMNKIKELNAGNISTEGFRKLSDILITITDNMVNLGGMYINDMASRFQKTIEGFLVYTIIKKDSSGKETGEKSTQAGIFTLIGNYVKSLQNLFKENGTFDMLSNINLWALPTKRDIEDIFEHIGELLTVIITYLHKQGFGMTDTQLIITYGDEYIQKIQSIISSVNTILTAIVDMIDPKKNPLIANPAKLLIIKVKIEKTFKMMRHIIVTMLYELRKLVEFVQKETREKEINTLKESFEKISSIFKSITDIMESVIKMTGKFLAFIASSVLMIPAMFIFIKIVKSFMMVLSKIIEIEDKQIKDVKQKLAGIAGIFKSVMDLISGMRKSLLQLLIITPLIIIGVAFLAIFVLFMSVFVWELRLLITSLAMISNRSLKRTRLKINLIQIIFAGILLLCVALLSIFIAFTPSVIKTIIGGLLVLIGLMLLIVLTLKLTSWISKIVKLKDVLATLLILAVTSLIIGAFMGIAILLVLLQEIIVQIKILPIILFIGGIALLAVVLLGVGLLLVPMQALLIPAGIAILATALFMILAVGALWLIATMLNEISKIDLDADAIAATINKIFTTADLVINAMFKSPEDKGEANTKDDPWWKAPLKWLGDSVIGKLMKSLMTMVYLAQILACVTLLKWIADSLYSIQEIKLESGKIINGVDAIFATADNVVEYVCGKNSKFDEDDLEDTEDRIKIYENIIEALVDVQEDFNKIKNLGDKTQYCLDLVNVIDTLNKSFTNVNEKKIGDTLKHYDKFLKRIDDTDLKKLETTTHLFGEMAKFSQSINGNFEQLAEVLNEKIAPILEELKESVGSVETTVTKPTGVEAEKQGIRNSLMRTGQTNNLSNSEIDAKVDDRYKDNVQQRYGIDEILSKLSSIVDLFQNGDARVRTT